MKLKRRRSVEVPAKIRSFIDGVFATPLENIEEPLKSFVWDFDKGDFHHWVELFNYFDTFFEKHIKPRKDLLLEDDLLEHDHPFPREAVLQILRVMRIILDNCGNKHLYSSYEHHLSSLLASTDADVIESCLQTLAAFLKKSIGKYVIQDNSLSSKLFAFAQGWGAKEEGLGLIACALDNKSYSLALELGSTLHFEFYIPNESIKIIHLPNVSTYQISDRELMQQLIKEYKVPVTFRFSLLTRLRFARAFGSFSARQQYTCIRLHAFMVFVQACSDTNDLVTFFNTEPGFINELVTLLSYEDAVPEKIRILCLFSLIALCQDRSRQPTVLSTVTSGLHRGILSTLTHKAIDDVASKSPKRSVVFTEALISLVNVLVSSSSGCSAMRESGFIPTLLPLLKDTDPQHLHLVSTAAHVLEAFMDYSNPAGALFRELGGLDDTIFRLKLEVSHFENGSNSKVVDGDNMQPLYYSDALVTRHRRSLMKALLRAISFGTYAPGTTSHVYDSEESLLPYCLCVIFKQNKDFGGGVFSLAATVMSDLIHKDPTCFSVLEASGLPYAFLDAIMDGVTFSSEAITCIPQCLDALCLSNNGLQAVKDHNALRCFVKIFTARNYVRALTGDTPSSLSSGLDELMRHVPSLRGHGVDVIIEIIKGVEKIGYGPEVAASVPMKTDAESSADTSLSNVESFLPDCVNNAARLLENILQNSDTCRVFIEKKGVEAVLKLFTLPLMPLSVSVGQIIAVGFKNFSSHHSAFIARALCVFMRDHLKLTNEVALSLGGMQLAEVEDAKRMKVFRCLSSLEGILSLSISLTKGSNNLVSELAISDADVLKDLGVTFREILWQLSMCCESKLENVDVVVAEAGGDVVDVSVPGVRYTNPVSHPHSDLEREFLSIVRTGEVFSQRNRHGLSRLRAGRPSRQHIDSDSSLNYTELTSSQDVSKKSPEVLVVENLNKLASTLRSFFISLIKGFTLPNRQRTETGSSNAASKSIGAAMAKVFLEALSFSGYTAYAGHDTSLTLKCRYLGKVVDDMAALTYDSRRCTCFTFMINNFYVHGTFKELLNTFEATSQLLWTLPCSVSTSGSKMSHGSWLLNTLMSYCHVLEFFVDSTLLLPPDSSSRALLVTQPVAVGLSDGLFPVPNDPKVFVSMLQSQVLDVILPVWNHPMFPSCNHGFVTSIVTLLNHVCCGVSDAKLNHGDGSGGVNLRGGLLLDEATISTIVEMGFTRTRAEEALRRVERNSVEMAMEWLFTHADDHVHEEEEEEDDDDDDMAEAVALSLGNSSENFKTDNTEKTDDTQTESMEIKTPPIDDILTAVMKLVKSSDSIAFPLTDLLITLCARNKGEDKTKVISYLIQQMKLCPLEISNDTSPLCTISHTLALLLAENIATREIAAENEIVFIVIDILMDFTARTKFQNELPVPKCISALLLILDSLLQSGPKSISDSSEATKTGYLNIEDGNSVIIFVLDMIKQNVPSMVMQAVLLLCARLTKTHTLATQFLNYGGMDALFSIPRSCFFLSYDSVTSAIIRHLIEDPQTLQTAMELEIRQSLSANSHSIGIPPRAFLTSMAPLICRDPGIFMKAAATVCQLESYGGRTVVALSKVKEKEKEKEKSKVSGVEIGASREGPVKPKSPKKIPANLSQVIHHMLEIIHKSSSLNQEEECTGSANAMEVDEPGTSKGKSKVEETIKESDTLLERYVGTAKLTFVLKLLTDILLMYVHAVGIVLKRDLGMCQHGEIVHHIVHQFLNPKSDESRTKLSEKASWFLVVLCGRSSEGRKRVINELVKVIFSFSNSLKGSLLPDKKVVAFIDLVYSILSKNSSSSNLLGSGCSPDIAKGMIDGGMIPCLSSVLQVLDLDHPDASKVVNIILKVLESLTRAANASEQLSLSNKKKSVSSGTRSDNQMTAEPSQNSQLEVMGTDDTQQLPQQSDNHSNLNEPMEETETVQPSHELAMGFMHEEMEDSGMLQNSDQIGDDDMGDDGEDDDEDGDIEEDGTALMSLADTDLDDHDESGLGDGYNDDMVDDVDEDDDDYHENHVIEVRWREALDSLHHMQVLGPPGGDNGLIDMAAEPFEGRSGFRRPLGFDRRSQQNRTPSARSRHPLLSRPSGGNSLHNLESLTDDVANFNMFDADVAPTPLGDFSIGLGTMYTSERRGLGDSRWTDDGQPQAGDQAAAIAQSIEEQFMSQIHRQDHNSASLVSQSDAPIPDDNPLGGNVQQSDGHQDEIDQNTMHLEPNQMVETDVAVEQTEDLQAHEPSLDVVNEDNMEIGEGDGSVNEQENNETISHQLVPEGNNAPNSDDHHTDADMNVADSEANENTDPLPSEQNIQVAQDNSQTGQSDESGVAPDANGIDPTFLEALPEDLRAEVLASQQPQSTSAPALSSSDVGEDIDPEFLAALPPDIQAEVLAQQRAQRVEQLAEGQPVDMDNASIIATFPDDLRHEVLLTSSESVISALPSPLLAEAQMLRDRAMSHYHARSLFGSNHGHNNQRNYLGFDRQTVIDRGVGVTIGHRASSMLAESLKMKDVDGDPLLDTDALKALIRLLRLVQPLGKGLVQRLLLNLCAHSCTRETLVYLLVDMIKPETEGPVVGLTKINSQRLYGCQYNVVYGRSQLIDGLPPLVLHRILEILTYLATNHSSVADILFYFDSSHVMESLISRSYDKKNDKGKEKIVEEGEMSHLVPILLFTKLLNHPLFLQSTAHLEQVLGLLQVVVYTAASKLDCHPHPEHALTSSQGHPENEAAADLQRDSSINKSLSDGLSTSDDKKSVKMYDIFMKLPQTDLHHLCSLLGHEGLSDTVYTLTGEVLKKLASIAPLHRNFFIVELSDLAQSLSKSAIHELITLRNTQMLGLSTESMAGTSVLRILQTLNSLTVLDTNGDQEHITMWKLNVSLEPLWQELSECISVTESQLANIGEHTQVSSSLSPLPHGTQRLLPFIEAFLVLCEKLRANSSVLQQDKADTTASEVKELTVSGVDSQRRMDADVAFTRFVEKHRRILNAFIRQDPGLLEKSLSMLLKVPRLMDFDNKRSYFRSRIRKQHEQHLAGPLRISVRRAYVLEDSYNQLRKRPNKDMKGRLNVRFRGEEGIDAGGLTREWYQLLSRVIFDKGTLLFTTGGNNATYQPNPNSVYQTEHLSYFKFVGRVVAKALFDSQLLDVYFTRSFYKHILGVKVTYHDIEAVDPDYYKNLKWMLENDVSDIPDLTFSMDADEEKHILYEKTEVTDYELKPGGGNIRVTEETKHEYVDLVADHILTNAIRPQINSFLEGFNELIPRELISIFNDKELELLISGLPEINLDDLKANTEYSGYTVASSAIIWFWEVVKAFNKEDRARLLQFVSGTSKVPLEGFKALQGISGPQRFQIHKAYGASDRLPSAHTCFNQLDLPEYGSKEQLQERLLLAIHEGSEGFGFG